jgi:hypothetical protein
MDLFYLILARWELPRLLEFTETMLFTLKTMPSDEWPPDACIQPGYLLPHFTLGGPLIQPRRMRHLAALTDLMSDMTAVLKEEKVTVRRLEEVTNAARAWFVVLYFYDARIQLLVQVPHPAHRIWRTVPPDEIQMGLFRENARGTVGNYILDMNHLAEHDCGNIQAAHDQTRFFLNFICQWWKPGIRPTFTPPPAGEAEPEKQEEEPTLRQGSPPPAKKVKR